MAGHVQSSTNIPVRTNVLDDVRMLRVELDALNKKLQRCNDTIVFQANELTILRNIICQSCKRKSLDAMFDSSPSPAPLGRHLDGSLNLAPQAIHQASSSVPEFPVPFHSTCNVVTPQSPFPHISSSTINLPQPPQASSSSKWAAAPRAPQHFRRTETTVATSSSDTSGRSDNSEFPWSVPNGPNKLLDVTFERAFAHKGQVNCLKFSLDGKYVAMGLSGMDLEDWCDNGEVIVYNTETGKQTCRLVEPTEQKRSGVLSMTFSPNGRQLAVGHFGGNIRLWLIACKRVRNVFRHNWVGVADLDFSPNGQTILSALGDDHIRIWSVRDGSSKVVKDQFIMHRPIRRCVKFSPNGNHVAAAHGYGLRIWNSRTRQLVVKWQAHGDVVSSLAFMPDGKGLVSGSSDGTIKCWDVTTFVDNHSAPTMKDTVTLFREFEGHKQSITSIAIAADGQWLLSGSHDRTARIWNISNGMQQRISHGHPGRGLSVDIGRVGNYLAIRDGEGQVSLWKYKVI